MTCSLRNLWLFKWGNIFVEVPQILVLIAWEVEGVVDRDNLPLPRCVTLKIMQAGLIETVITNRPLEIHGVRTINRAHRRQAMKTCGKSVAIFVTRIRKVQGGNLQRTLRLKVPPHRVAIPGIARNIGVIIASE